MNNTLRQWLYILISVLIFGAVAMFFITILPYLIIGGIIIYVISRFRNKNVKENSENSNSYQKVYDNKKDYSSNNKTENNEGFIDVDFKDVE